MKWEVSKNKKGTMFLGFIFAFFFFILGMLVLPFMQDEASSARTSLNCTNSSISDGNKTTCLMTSGAIPYFIIAILIFIGGFVGNEL